MELLLEKMILLLQKMKSFHRLRALSLQDKLLKNKLSLNQKNRKNLNVMTVLCTGDLVDQNSCIAPPFPRFGNLPSEEQWEGVSRIFSRLDNVLPYVISPGNHDYGYTRSESPITEYPRFLPISRNEKNRERLVATTFNRLGVMTLENSAYEYHDPVLGNVLIVTTEYAPRKEVLDWVHELCMRDEYKDWFVIFMTHSYLGAGMPAGYVMNGFSYPANRWMWAYALLVGTMTATALPELAEAGWKKLTAGLLLFTAVVLVCVCWEYTFSRSSSQSVILGLLGMSAALIGRLVLLEKEREQLVNGTSTVSADNGTDKALSPEPESGAAGQDETLNLNGLKKKISMRVQAVIVLCAMLSIASAAYYDYAPRRSAKVFEYLSRAQIDTYTAKDSKAASDLIDGQLLKAEADENGKVPFYRYTTYNPENNTSILYGVSNTQYYWSLSDPSVSQFLNETGQLNRMIHLYDTLDDRTFLNEIAGIRYFLGNDEDGVPYGYEKKEGLSYNNNDIWPDNADLERYSCEVYENKYALPFGFTTSQWISRQDYDKMDIPERQQALMQGIVMEIDPGEGFTQIKPASAEAAGAAAGNNLVFTDKSVPVQIEYKGENVPVESGKKITFESTAGGEVVRLSFAGMQNCETALYIRGLEYTSPPGESKTTKLLIPVTGYIGEETAASKQIGYTTSEDPWTTGRRDFLVNMLYQDQPLDRIELVLYAPGTYTFDSIEVVCQPMTGYAEQAEALRASSLTDLDIHEMGNSSATDRITGHIEAASPQILCLQIPHTAGWAAYVDGNRVEILQADTMFSALLVPEGSHDIELRYQTPGLRFGAAVSLGTLVLLVLFILIYTIVSAVLHRREKRLASIPVGTFEQVESTESTGNVENTDHEKDK